MAARNVPSQSSPVSATSSKIAQQKAHSSAVFIDQAATSNVIVAKKQNPISPLAAYNVIYEASSLPWKTIKQAGNFLVQLPSSIDLARARKETEAQQARAQMEQAKANADVIKAQGKQQVTEINKQTDLMDYSFLESVFQSNEKKYYEAYLSQLEQQKKNQVLMDRLGDYQQYQNQVAALEKQGYPVSTDGLTFADFTSGSSAAYPTASSSGFNWNKAALYGALAIAGIIVINNLTKKKG